MIKNKSDLDIINKRIEKELCYDTIEKLSDVNLLDEYKNSKSVKNEINKLSEILQKHKINDVTTSSIVNDYLLELIPPGTKGVIRGNEFNRIIKNEILNLKLDEKEYDVSFEKECSLCKTSEKPDWYIIQKATNKVMIGMNQLDLWNGGQQLNRGYKYLVDNKINTEKSKLLCVVCNNVKINNKNKIYTLFKTGFDNNTLCYIKNLSNIIKIFFK
jgi:predicted transcriptional regulator